MDISLDEFIRRVAPDARPGGATADLYAILASSDVRAPLSARLDWIETLADWVLRGPALRGRDKTDPPATQRLRLLLRSFEEVPAAAVVVGAAFRSVLGETSALRLLAGTGLPGHHGFLAETFSRLAKRILPAPRRDEDLADLAPRMFSHPRDADWLRAAPRGLIASFATTLRAGTGASDPAWHALREAVLDAVDVLAVRIAALGLAEDVHARGPSGRISGSPFLRLQKILRGTTERARAGEADPPEDVQARADALRDCRSYARNVLSQLDRQGVSVDLVYRLELLNKSLLRVERLTGALAADDSPAAAADLLVALVRDGVRDRSIRALVHANLRQLSRKIVDRSGATGEHYITATATEWRAMIASAAGGGVLTAVTTLLKFQIHALHMAPFFFGLTSSLNYAGSFVVMQLAGFTLATKQPSMTAAALARGLAAEDEEGGRPSDLQPMVEQIARITRSQLAAAFGNLLFVTFAATMISAAVLLATGTAILSPEKSRGVIESLHPLATGSIFYASITGLLLWFSSVCAGGFENWAVYHGIPDGIASSRRLRRWLGPNRAENFAAWFGNNLAGLGGNVALGFLLGMLPVFGKFFGAPIDVRHVTLSMGSLSFAGFSLVKEGLPLLPFLWAMAGILVIGALNFGVSFAFALVVALRARDVGLSGHWRLVKAVARRLIFHPREFVLPPSGRRASEDATRLVPAP